LSRGVVFVPFHWGDQQGENMAANYLTIPAIDRIAKQPEFKYCAVRLAPADDAPSGDHRGLHPDRTSEL
jgi:sulfite reductase (NADPH) flavoprotein alpha-component